MRYRIFSLFFIILILSCSKKEETTYQFTKLEIGSLENIVSTTGTLYPITTYKIFSKTTGTISKVNFDYNAVVKKGQILAEFDKDLLKITLKETEANFIKSEIQYNQAKKNYEDIEYLYSKNLKSKNELDNAYDSYKTAQAGYIIAEAGLEKAKMNLDYSVIKSPADGIIIEKNINEGDNVNSGTQSLFVIASDLSKMKVEALIDENDIGMIKNGLKTRLSVMSLPDDLFYGKVTMIKPKTTTVQNIVNFTVVIETDNLPSNILPGMTANIDILIDSKENVLKVPNSALKFNPPQDIMRAVMLEMRGQLTNQRTGVRTNQTIDGRRPTNFNAQFGGQGNGFNQANGNSSRGRIWFTNEQGKLLFATVNLGITDGQYTEIIGRNLTNGMQIITSMKVAKTANIFSFGASRTGTGGGQMMPPQR